MEVVVFVPRSQVPSIGLAEPANRRLEQTTVVVDQVRPSARSGTERKLDLRFCFGEDFARSVQASFPVIQLFPSALDLVLEALSLEVVMRRRVVPLQITCLGDWSQRATHGMLSIGGCQGSVAASAHFIAHIAHVGTHISIRRIQDLGHFVSDRGFFRLVLPFRQRDDEADQEHSNKQDNHGLQWSSEFWRSPAAKRLGIHHYAIRHFLLEMYFDLKWATGQPAEFAERDWAGRPVIISSSKTRLDFVSGIIKMTNGRMFEGKGNGSLQFF